MSARSGAAAVLTVLLAGSACELTETQLAQPEEALIVEAFVRLGDPDAKLFALAYNTIGTGPVPDATIRITRDDGSTIGLHKTNDPDECRVPIVVPEGADPFFFRTFPDADCYDAAATEVATIAPGEFLEIEVLVADGRRLQGQTTVPGDFELLRPVQSTGACTLLPDILAEFEWTGSENAWAYVAETSIAGLSAYSQDVDEPLDLLGLAISSEDTTLVFPSEFGVFDRFELDQEVALQLQKGLPPGTGAVVFVAATDRNFVNWVRGGNFNPSGAVRIPSLRGDGFGVFASYVQRFVFINQTGPGPQTPNCRLQ